MNNIESTSIDAKKRSIEVDFSDSKRSLRTFPRLSSESFQHPDDKDASKALQAFPLLPELFKAINAKYFDQRIRMEHLTYNLRISRTQGNRLYDKFIKATRILDLQVLPELYLNTHPTIYAYSMGMEQPVVVLSQGCVDQLSEGELFAVIGHELGHIKCRHGLNKSLGLLLSSAGAGGISAMFPVIGPTALVGLKAALNHWARMAEFSCDRAAMLVVQDHKLVAEMLAKLSGFHKGVVPDFNFESVFAQLDDYDHYDQNSFQSLVKLQKLVLDALDQGFTHPSPILRIKRILDWGQSDHYHDLLDGHYLEEDLLPPPLPMVQASVRCPACGEYLPEDARFCSHCGSRLA